MAVLVAGSSLGPTASIQSWQFCPDGGCTAGYTQFYASTSHGLTWLYALVIVALVIAWFKWHIQEIPAVVATLFAVSALDAVELIRTIDRSSRYHFHVAVGWSLWLWIVTAIAALCTSLIWIARERRTQRV